jgi:elongator complex protein 4
MDRLLGGGLPLGSLTLILEDGWSQHHVTLLRYFLGEGTACNQRTLLVSSTEPEGGIASFLPKLLDPVAAEKEKEAKKKEEQEDAVQLKIAWQYGRYLKPSSDGTSSNTSTGGVGSVSSGGVLHSTGQQQQRNSGQNRPAGRDWCHVYDLSKPAASGVGDGGGEEAVAPAVELVLCGDNDNISINTAVDSREKLITSVAAFISPPPPSSPAPAPQQQKQTTASTTSVSRVAVLSLGDAAWNLGGTISNGGGLSSTKARRTAVQSLLQLKAVVRDTKSCALVTVPAAYFTNSDKRRMSHIADIVLSLQAVQDDSDIVRLAPDSSTVSGLLHLEKLASMGLIAAPAPQNPLYLVRSKRRRMAITPVEIDPDAEEADAAGGGGGGGAAAAVAGVGSGRTPASALLCGGPAKGKPDLDF